MLPVAARPPTRQAGRWRKRSGSFLRGLRGRPRTRKACVRLL